MIWKAVMNDGSQILESDNGIDISFNNLDKENVETFGVVDSLETIVKLDLSSGSFNMANLDLRELTKLTGDEEIKFKYDPHTQNFKLETESIGFINSLLVPRDKLNVIEFDQTGVFNICGSSFYMGFESDELYEFKNQPPYKDIIHIKDAYADFYGSSNEANPYKRIDMVRAYTVGYNKTYTFNTKIFNLSLVLKYEVIQKCVTINCIITSNEDISGKLIVFFDGKQSALDVMLPKNERAKFERVLTVI